MSDQLTTGRAVPSSVADVLTALELRQPKVVTRELLLEVLEEVHARLPVEVVAERLVRLGWLLPMRTRGSWEFAPAAHAGRFGWDDPWIELRALLLHEPGAPVAIAFESAIWEHGWTSHQPDKPVLAHRPLWRPRRALPFRHVSYDWKLPAGEANGLPSWEPATAVVAAAHRPDAQGDWGNADEWLPEAFGAAQAQEVLLEADGRGNATLARLGHLAEWSGRHDVADAVDDILPQRRTVSFLGPRKPRGRWVSRWRLYDSLLRPR